MFFRKNILIINIHLYCNVGYYIYNVFSVFKKDKIVAPFKDANQLG